MPDSYTVLYGKYQRALVTVREITQEKERAENKLHTIENDNKQLEKSTRTLCETVMKRGKASDEEKTWFKMSLKDMVDAAQESIEGYFPSVEGMIKNLLEKNKTRTSKIIKLQTDIDKMKAEHEDEMKELENAKDEVIAELTKKLRTGRVDDLSEIEKITKASSVRQKDDIDMDDTPGTTEILLEDEDGLEDIIDEGISAEYEYEENVIPATKGPKVNLSNKVKEKIKDTVDELTEREDMIAAERAGKMSDAQKLILRIIGETGFSEMTEIVEAAKTQFPDLKSVSTIKSVLHGIIGKSEEADNYLLVSYKIPVPGSSNFAVYMMTKLGKIVFRYLFGKDPKMSHAEMVMKAHTTLEHGYGIRNTAKLIEKMPFMQKYEKTKVTWLTRSKEYMIKTGPNSSYIPDIIIEFEKNGKPQRRYVEYETGKCAEADFYAKCSKMAVVSKYINIVVPNKEAKEATLAKIEKWRSLVKDNPSKFPENQNELVFQISTYKELEDKKTNHSNDIEWDTTTSVSKPKGKGTR